MASYRAILSSMDRSSRRVVDDDRLADLWLRRFASDFVFYAPVQLPDGTMGIAQAELRTIGGYGLDPV